MSYVNIYAERPSGVVEFYAQVGDQVGNPAALLRGANASNAVAADATEYHRDLWLAGMLTDKALVKRADLPTLAVHLRSFAEEHPAEAETLLQVVGVLDLMSVDAQVVAVGFQFDDSASGWFVTRDAEGDTPAEDRSYDTSRDTGHWYLTPATMVQAEQPSAETTPTEEPQSGKRRRTPAS